MANPPTAPRPIATRLRALALASVALCGAGCSLAMVRPYPRDGACNSRLLPILDGSMAALGALMVRDAAVSPVRADCPDGDSSCYTTVANRQSDVRAWGSIAALYAGSTAWGVWSRARCRERQVTPLEPPLIPGRELPQEEPGRPPSPTPATAEPAPPAGPAGPPAATEEPPHPRAATYLSAWLGHGGGASYRADGGTWFQTAPFIWLPVPLAAGLGFGAPAGSRLLLGVEWNLVLGVNCVGSLSAAEGGCDRSTFIQQFAAVATWFPSWDGPPAQAPGGVFVRGGPALALLRSSYVGGEDPGEPPLPASQTALWTRTGAGVLAGVGVAVPFGRGLTRTLDGGFDFSWQEYGASATLPERSWWMILHGGVTFH